MPEAVSEPSLSIREVFGFRDFRYLWIGQIISNFGDSLTNFTLLLLINHLTGSVAAMATTKDRSVETLSLVLGLTLSFG